MEAEEFRDLIAGAGDNRLCKYLDVAPATFRRWKTGKARVPQAVIKLLKFYLHCDLSGIGGEEWEGFVMGQGYLSIPLFHRPFTGRQLSALFFQVGDNRANQSDLKQAMQELGALRAELEEVKKREAFYRRQCQIESKMGLMLHRIVD